MSDQNPAPRQNREVVVLAALGLVIATLTCVAGLAYAVAVQGDSSAALISIASIGIGSLATLAGAAATKRADKSPSETPNLPSSEG